MKFLLQAVSLRLITVDVRVLSWEHSCEIYGGLSGVWTGFSLSEKKSFSQFKELKELHFLKLDSCDTLVSDIKNSITNK
jgi:hypothetical protein